MIGTLNVGRMGEAEAHFEENEFELVQLFAGQASTALQTAEALRAVLRADHDALTGLGNHGDSRATSRAPHVRPRGRPGAPSRC